MINSMKIAAHFLESLPKDRLSPETTEGREGFVHCVAINGNEEQTTLKFIIRDFEVEKLKEYEDFLTELANNSIRAFPGSKVVVKVNEQYRNMKYILKDHPHVSDYALDAMKRLDITPIFSPIRGGTDGSRLSFMGLPTPNIFAGEHSFHSKTEWVAIQDMEMAVRVIVTIATIWEEKS
jgi:tripeptide aminopeptidase